MLALVGTLGLAIAKPFGASAASSSEPNVVLIVSDDQTLEEMRALPNTTSLIGGAGVTFDRAYVSYPLCCPSRATIFSGQYMHNHNVRGNSLPDGSWYRFDSLGTEDRALPTWTQAAGYYNVEIGKYMNGYGELDPKVPPGWDEWYGKLSEYNVAVHGGAIYFNYRMLEDRPAVGGVKCPGGSNVGTPAKPYIGGPFTCSYGENPQDYQTDVLGEKAVEAIKRLGGPGSQGKPFFLSVDFNAPHSPYVPAPRHDGQFAGAQVSKVPALNEKNISDKPRFLRRLPKISKGKRNQVVKRRRARLEMLLSLDDQVTRIVNTLAGEGELDNTYVIFISDNGYFSGEHRIRQGKYLPHEPSSHVPLMIRGPGIPAGQSSDTLVSNVDIAATVADIADAGPALTQDGQSLLPLAASPNIDTGRPILLEGDTGQGIDDDGAESTIPNLDADDQRRLRKFYKKRKAKKKKLARKCRKLKKKQGPKRARLCYRDGVANLEQEPTDTTYKLTAPAYVGLRTDRYAIFLYSTGELELYDMYKDPNQTKSLHDNKRFKKVRKWLLARLDHYRKCAGAACNASAGEPPPPAKKKKKPKKKPKQQAPQPS